MTDSKNIKIAIVLVTSLFFLWGVSYGLIDVMNKIFKIIFTLASMKVDFYNLLILELILS